MRFSADVVVVAAGAVNSAALLLRSANDRHPDGLANGSDVVGRHYMRHNNLALMAVSKEPNPTRFQKTLALQRLVPRARTTGTTRSAASRCSASPTPSRSAANAPRWAGRRLTGDAVRGARPPRRRLLAVRGGPAAAGEPGHPRRATASIHLTLDEKNNIEGLKRLRHKLQGMLGDLGMHEQHLLDHSIYLHKGMPIGATAHQAGTVRFGTDPASSALDVNCRAHERGQPLRRRHQLLPEHRRGEPVADRHRERAARRGPHARTTRLSTLDDRTGRTGERAMDADRVDALVIFGATGDLAKLETFPALVGLVERGVLDVPIVGVAKSGWDLDQLPGLRRRSPCGSTAWTRMRRRRARCSACCATSTAISTTRRPTPRCPQEMGSGRRALFYLEVPPLLFGRIAEGISAAGRADGARVMVEKPFGNDLDGARALNATMHEVLPGGRDLPGRPLARASTRSTTSSWPGSPTR